MSGDVPSGYVTFRPRARLMKLLGAELISDDVVAVTELVKNAHDADATRVTLSFNAVAGNAGEIIISDNGTGMDRDTLLHRWMEPASSGKSDGARLRTRRGRRVLGEKGVGRFACDKLAATLELSSRCSGEGSEVHSVFNWDRFDTEDLMLSDVTTRWEIRPATAVSGHGTVLRLSHLRTSWSERMFRRLCTRLARLISPFDGTDDFRIKIESDEFPEYSGEIRPDLLDKAPYRIEASFDGKQSVTVAVNGSRTVEHRWNGTGNLECGPVRVRIFAFDLDAMRRIGPATAVRAWLREWAGASVYRDGFRIWPYGEPHDDWLRLDQRRVNNPVVRLSNNQIVGFVEITKDGNAQLHDQTSREGLIHNRAFDDLRRLMYFVLQLLEAERQRLRHPPPHPSGNGQPSGTNREGVSDSLSRLARKAGPELSDELSSISERLDAELDRREQNNRRLIERYATLAAAGQASEGLQGSLRSLLLQLHEHHEQLGRALDGRKIRGAASPFKGIEDTLEAIEARVSLITPLEAGGTGRHRRTIDVPAELKACSLWLGPMLSERRISLEVTAPRKGVLRVELRPETFARILHLLATNSIDWLHHIGKPRVRVTVRARGHMCEVLFSDNGPGIARELSNTVFEPGFSGKEGGNGMGLTIANTMVVSHGGTIEVVTDRRRRGANIRILVPLKRSRAT